LKLIGGKEMKNKILINFSIVFVINIILDILLYKYTGTDLGLKNTIILLGGSYLVYWILNLYIIFLKNNNKLVNYRVLCKTGLIVCFITLCVLIINLKDDQIIFFPIMYIISLLFTFLNWTLYDRK
jgi:hypothetical protein